MSSLALLVDSTSPSPRSLPRCLSSCTAGGDGHWSARSSQGSLHPQGPTRQPDRSPVSAPSPASCSHGAVRSENRPRRLSVIHSTTVHTRTAQSQGRRGPALRKLTVQQGSRGGVRRALMGYGRKQSQEGFPEEAAMKLKEQKDRDGHPGGDGGTHQGRGPEQRHCCRGSERARLPDRAQGSREREGGECRPLKVHARCGEERGWGGTQPGRERGHQGRADGARGGQRGCPA